MPTVPRSLQAICRVRPVRKSSGCLVDAKGMRSHTSTNHCPMFTQHTPLNKISYNEKLFQYKACCSHFSQHLSRKTRLLHYQQSRARGSSYPTDANQQGEGNTTEKGPPHLQFGANKTFHSIGQSKLTITVVNYINPPSVCQNLCQFFSVVPRYPSSSNMYAILDCRRRLPLDCPQEEQQFASNPAATLRHSG